MGCSILLFILGISLASVASQSQTNDDVVAQMVISTVNNGKDSGKFHVDIDPFVDCYTEDGSTGYCVKYFECDPESSKRQNPRNDSRRYKKQCGESETCCKKENVRRLNEPQPGEGPSSDHKVSSSSTTKPGGPSESVCGRSNPGALPSIRVGEHIGSGNAQTNAVFGEYPWMTAILVRREPADNNIWSEDYVGGGALIHPSVVLTVVHKLYTDTNEMLKADQLKCRAGEYDVTTTGEIFPHQDREVDRYIIHDEYNKEFLLNDAVLLIMKSPFVLDPIQAPHIGTACLAPAKAIDNTLCYGTGWGLKKNDESEPPTIPKKVEIETVNAVSCEDALQRKRFGPYFRLHNSFMCARVMREGSDHCFGDGGSPLACPVVVNGEQRFVVQGLTCYGLDCGKRTMPGVYVNVPNMKEWIDRTMRSQNFDTSYYTITDERAV